MVQKLHKLSVAGTKTCLQLQLSLTDDLEWYICHIVPLHSLLVCILLQVQKIVEVIPIIKCIWAKATFIQVAGKRIVIYLLSTKLAPISKLLSCVWRCLVQIPAGSLTPLTEVSHSFPQFFRVNAGMYLTSGPQQYLPHFQCIIYHRQINWCYTIPDTMFNKLQINVAIIPRM